MISYCCSIVVEETPGPTVVIAIGTTLLITIAITIYCFLCKANFLVLIGIVLVVAIVMMMVAIVAIFSLAPIMISIYCGLAVILYGIYIVVITKMIIGG